jgi:CDP-glucose 4,6-dehydratase
MSKSLSEIYHGKKVFLTGHTGFKGSWLSLWLNELGAEVTGYALAPDTTPSLFDELKLSSSLRHIVSDIRDFDALSQAMNSANPDVVIHMAAQALVQPSYKNPRETYESNVMGTVNLLEAVRACDSVRSCLIVTSDKCYDNLETDRGYRETDAMGGYDPYSSSKGCSELVTNSWRKSYFNPDDYGSKHSVALASGRAGNVIGGGDWAEARIVPDIARAISVQEDVVLRNPGAIRPWQHVMEPLAGYLHVTAKLMTDNVKYASGWNFGPKTAKGVTVEELVGQMIEAWGMGSYSVSNAEQPHEAKLLYLDISKADELLNWRPKLDAEEAIRLTSDWYKSFYSGCRGDELVALTLSHINEYQNSMNYAQY